ncbi:MAG: lipopolysaccharide biosynthesis protein, partial [Muribaculaceae bacterium]
MSEVKVLATKSIIWSAIERFSVQGMQLILTIIIARFLMPSDYGLIAMLSIFMAIAQTFIDSGFANALIQKKDRTNIDYSTVFYFNILISLVLYFCLYLSSPAIATFYNEPKLDYITKIFGLVIIINSFGIVQQAKLTVELNFKRQAQAALLAVIFSGVAGVWLAYSGYGVWALVWQALLNNILRVLLLWTFSKWMPMIVFSKRSFNVLFSFGSKLLGSSLLHTIYVNLYTLIIGKIFSADICGLYNQAYKLSNFPSSNLTNIIVRAIYPIQCRMQDDNVQLRDTYLKYLRMSCYVIFPVMTAFCALAKPVVIICLKDQWLPVVPLLQILCIAYMWTPIMQINGSILNVKGRSDLFLKAEIVKKIVAFGILIGTIPLGITAMCLGLVAYSFADMIIISYYTNKVINITFFSQLKSVFPIILLSFSMGGIVYIITLIIATSWIQLCVGSIVGVTYYAAISYLFKSQELKLLLSLHKNKL